MSMHFKPSGFRSKESKYGPGALFEHDTAENGIPFAELCLNCGYTRGEHASRCPETEFDFHLIKHAPEFPWNDRGRSNWEKLGGI